MAAIRKIRTARLAIEPAFIEDRSKELAEAIHLADEFEWYFGIEETFERLKELSIKRKMFYNIFDAERHFIGYVGFHREEDAYEIEMYILKQFRKNGYAKESLVAMLDEAFNGRIPGTKLEDFSKIISSVRIENHASRKLMESCGFEENKEIGFCLLYYVADFDDELGNPIQLVHYYITRENFESMKERSNFE